jgi:enamine deaminase RidA (YjgF/YER057c/UK114 family)
MKKEIIAVPAMKDRLDPSGKPRVPLSRVVRAGDFIFVAGLPPPIRKPVSSSKAISASNPAAFWTT